MRPRWRPIALQCRAALCGHPDQWRHGRECGNCLSLWIFGCQSDNFRAEMQTLKLSWKPPFWRNLKAKLNFWAPIGLSFSIEKLFRLLFITHDTFVPVWLLEHVRQNAKYNETNWTIVVKQLTLIFYRYTGAPAKTQLCNFAAPRFVVRKHSR